MNLAVSKRADKTINYPHSFGSKVNTDAAVQLTSAKASVSPCANSKCPYASIPYRITDEVSLVPHKRRAGALSHSTGLSSCGDLSGETGRTASRL